MEVGTPAEELFMAAVMQDEAAVSAALAKGADPNATNPAGMTALHVVCASADTDAIVEKLLRSGADPDARDVHGWSSLIYAASGGQVGLVKSLLATGRVDIHAATDGEPAWTALQRACRRGHSAVVECLGEAIKAASASPASAELAGAGAAPTGARPATAMRPQADLAAALALAEAEGHDACVTLIRGTSTRLEEPRV